MSRTFISPADGQVYYKTINQSVARAASFCRMIAANSTRFQNASVVASKAEGKFYVRYQPANQARYADLYAAQVQQRDTKGRTEGQCYDFHLHNDTQNRADFYLCKSTSGEVYEVTEASCSCPDYRYRCQRAGISCKHIMALACAIAAGDVESLAAVANKRDAERRAAIMAAKPNPYTVGVQFDDTVYHYCQCGNWLTTASEKRADACCECQSVHAHSRAYELTTAGHNAAESKRAAHSPSAAMQQAMQARHAVSGLRPDLDF